MSGAKVSNTLDVFKNRHHWAKLESKVVEMTEMENWGLFRSL